MLLSDQQKYILSVLKQVKYMCNYSYQHEDSDFMVGENVMLVVQRYDDEKLQMFGKIMSKW